MDLPRPTRSTVILSCCLLVMACGMAYQAIQLAALRSSLADAAEKTSVNAMLSRLDKIDDQLESVSGKNLVSQDDFRSAQQALSNRVDAGQALAKQALELGQRASTSGELLVLKATVEGLDESIQALRKSQSKAPPQASGKQSVAKRSQVQRPKPKPAAPEPPPFSIVGVEYRGGERFLSVAPTGSTQLSQIYLVRPGDAVAGTTWRLSNLDDRAARFDVAGNSRTINIQP